MGLDNMMAPFLRAFAVLQIQESLYFTHDLPGPGVQDLPRVKGSKNCRSQGLIFEGNSTVIICHHGEQVMGDVCACARIEELNFQVQIQQRDLKPDILPGYRERLATPETGLWGDPKRTTKH